MKILRITLVSLSGLLLASALAAPGFVGPKVEEIWKQQLPRLQGAEAIEYQRGWFGAETLTRVSGDDGITELRSDIQHGPLLFTHGGPRIGAVYSETRLLPQQLAPSLRAQLERFYGPLDESPLVIETLVGTDNRVRNTLRLLPIERIDGAVQVQFAGLELHVDTDYRGSLLTGALELGELTRSDSGRETLHWTPASGEFQLSPAGAGQLSLALPLLRAEADSGPLELRDATFSYSAAEAGDGALHVQTDLQLPQIQSATPVSSLQQQMNLPQVTAADLQHYLRTLVLTPKGSRNWPQVMQRPLQLQQQLAVESANGPVKVNLDMDWRGLAPGARKVSNSNQWLAPLSGTLSFSAAEQALLQSPLIGQAMTLRQYGLLVENGGKLEMLLQVDNGQLLVNGQLLPPELFLLALMGNF